MPSWIHFDPKFGWSELLSLLALLFSLVALWQVSVQGRQNLPEVVIDRRVPLVLISDDPTKHEEINVGLGFVITNRGGRPVSLLQIEQTDLPPFLRFAQSTADEDPHIEADYALIEGLFNPPEELGEQMITSKFRPFVLPQVINEEIDSGQTRSFALVLKLRDKRAKSLVTSRVAFACLLVFSDGSSYRLSQGIGF